jgi:hypothetical protein
MMMKLVRARKVSTMVLAAVAIALYLIPYNSNIITVAGQSSGNVVDQPNSRFKDVLQKNFQNIENVTDDSQSAHIGPNDFTFEHQSIFNELDEISAQQIESTAVNDAVNNAELSGETDYDECTVLANRLYDDLGPNNNYASQLNDQDTKDVVDGSSARNTGSNSAKFEEAGDSRSRPACPINNDISGLDSNEVHQANRQDIEDIYDRSSVSDFAENNASFNDGDGTSDDCIICE